ncbi:hypothetical protein [Nonomuraea wenchangensis]|uniref:hypothetical protein n=1 Tax=Nonomuraea wenchangensis TaxID=568860 RepID=UPI00332CF2F9
MEITVNDHLGWFNLPPHVRDAIAEQVGGTPKVHSVPAASGVFAARVYGCDEVYLKATPTSSPYAHLHKRERWAARHLPASAPVPCKAWELDCSGGKSSVWHVTAWDLINDYARPVDLQRASSSDVPAVLDAVAELGKLLTPCPSGACTIVHRLNPLVAKAQVVLRMQPNAIFHRSLYDKALNGFVIDRLNGPTLLHSNLSARHLLIKGQVVSVVGWAQVCAGQAWIDPALLAPHLIAGHWSPEEVHALLWAIPAWREAPPELMAGMTALWTLFHLHQGHLLSQPHEGSVRLADAGREWLTYLVDQM